jgi:hypothetical protein
MAKQVYNTWNTCIKLAWQVPRGTHTYFVERLLDCGMSHVRTDILARYVKYLTSLRSSPSMEVVVLANLVARDVRTTTGANLHYGPLEKLSEMPDQDRWRLPYLGRLLEERGERFHNMEDTVGITELIDSLCIN